MGRRHLLLGLAVLAALGSALAAAPKGQSLTLVRDGQPAATIVLAKEPTRVAQFAAYEMQWHLQQMSGATVPIVRDGEPTSGVKVLVGESEGTRALKLTSASFKPQEYLIRFLPGALVLMGRDKADTGAVQYTQTPTQAQFDTWPTLWDPQGTMYAIYDFLERYCGVRWLNPTEFGTDLPQRATVTVSGTEVRRAPYMKYRYACYPAAENYDHYTGLWQWGSEGRKAWEAAAYPHLQQQFAGGGYTLAKRGWNLLFRLRHREGGEQCPGNHSLYGYYNRFWEPAKGQEALFEAKHADWFAQGFEGKPPQMCYTSRGLIQQVAKDAREFFDSGKTYPGAQAAGNYFCVEPMDNASFCRCAACQKWLTGQDADSPYFSNGRNSDYFFNFVNEVAREVRKTHPSKWIVCLAYMTHAAHPSRVKLEPNVLVQYCFACNRLNFDRRSYEHEIKLLEEWRQKEPNRPLYLWLYYTFPREIADNGKFHCFPGFFAHAIGEQFALFQKYNYRGVFHCGYGQDVEAYVTYRLMDDPSLKLDALLDEYFGRLYGPAAKPMRQLYEVIEQTYGNPANYPDNVAQGKIEGHHHQTEEVAWGYLGTAPRMAQFGKLLEQATSLAQTPEQKQRVQLFRLGTWDYMVAGRKLYMEHAKGRYGGAAAPLRVPYVSGQPLNGDVARLDRSEALTLTRWRSRDGEPTRRDVCARVLNDGKYLYLQLEERTDPRTLKTTEDVVGGDYWEVLLAGQRQAPYYKLLLAPEGRGRATECSAAGERAWDPGGSVNSDRSLPGRWVVSCALPLDRLPAGGKLFANFARRSGVSSDQPVWVPTFGEFEDPSALRELSLDPASTIPTSLPTAAELEALRAQDLVACWPLDEGQGSIVKSAAGLKGMLVGKPAWVKDSGRSVLRLEDARRQYVDLGSGSEVSLSGPLSLIGWVRYEASEVWYPALWGKGYEASGTYGLHLRPGNTPWFELDAPDGTRNMYNPTDLCVTPGVWTHVAATYDGAMMRIYINGREAGPGKPLVTTIRQNNEPLRIGWLGSYGFLNGCVRDFALYRRALSREEVFARYREGR